MRTSVMEEKEREQEKETTATRQRRREKEGEREREIERKRRKTRARERKKRCSWDSLPPHYSVCSSISRREMAKARAPLFLWAFDNPRRYLVSARAATTHVRRLARVPFVSGVTITSIVPSRICISHIKWPAYASRDFLPCTVA